MKVKAFTIDAKESGEATLNKDLFGVDPRKDILHRVVNWQLAKRRAGTHKTKERGEVSGTTKKPFNQKGTGNARRGDNKAPHHTGGGKAHGPRPRSYEFALNRKVKNLGLKMALSSKAAEGNIVVLKDAELKSAKTKDFAKSLAKFGWNSALIIDGEAVNDNLIKAIGNIYKIDAMPTIGANVYDILNHEKLVITEAGLKKLEERLA